MYNANVILFFEFLKENKEVLENLDIHDLSLETVEDKLIPLAKKHGFNITAKDIFGFLSEYQKEGSGPIGDELLENVAGGKGNFNRFMAASLLTITGLTGIVNTNQAYAAVSGSNTSVSQSKSIKSSFKTIKDQKNNTLNDEEMKYYQAKIGNEYKFVSNKGKVGTVTTVYDIENSKGEKFVLKISCNPVNTEKWIKKQTEVWNKIKTYYKDYKGELKIPNYIKIGDDFIIEESLGEPLNAEVLGNLSPDVLEKLPKGLAEFMAFSHKQERGKSDEKYSFGCEGVFTLKDAYNYLNDAHVLNENEQTMLLDLIDKFNNRDKSDEISALTHCDTRLQNIVYNPKTEKFGLIDFDMLNDIKPIYYDFTSAAVGAFGIPYDISCRTVDYYNEISDTKIDKEKVKLFHKLGSMFEYCMVAKFRDKKTDNKQIHELWQNRIKPRFEEIDKGFLEEDKIETKHFKVTFPKSEKEKVNKVMETLKKNYLKVTSDLGVKFKEKTPIRFFINKDELHRNLGCYGFKEYDYIEANEKNGYIRSRLDLPVDELSTLLTHEFTHAAVNKLNPSGNTPFVLNDGIATYEAGQSQNSFLKRNVQTLPDECGWLMKSEMPDYLKYPFAYSFTEFIIKNYGYDTMIKLIKTDFAKDDPNFESVKDIYDTWKKNFFAEEFAEEVEPAEISQLETEHFKIEYPKVTEEKVKELSRYLEENYERITKDLGVSFDKKTSVKLFKTWSGFKNSFEEKNIPVPSFATGGWVNNTVRVRMDLGDEIAKKTLLHEFTHAATKLINPGTIPFFLGNGIAEYEAGNKPNESFYKSVKTLPEDSSWLLQKNMPDYAPYQFAYSFTEFIIKNYGYDTMIKLIKTNFEKDDPNFESIKDIYSKWRSSVLNN